MTEIHEIFRKALLLKLEHGMQTTIAERAGLTLSKVNKIVTGEVKGSEDDRRAIAGELGFVYEDLLDLGRRALGLPINRPEPPPAPEVAAYLAKARTVLEGPKGAALRVLLDDMSKE